MTKSEAIAKLEAMGVVFDGEFGINPQARRDDSEVCLEIIGFVKSGTMFKHEAAGLYAVVSVAGWISIIE